LNPFLALVPGQLGFGVGFLEDIFIVGTLITIVAFIAVFLSTKKPDEVDKHSLAKNEKQWTLLIMAVLVVFVISTLGLFPYPYAHSNVVPTMTVDVYAQQFSWCLSPAGSWGSNCQTPYQIPAGSTVLFQVRSADVTHGFGLYDSVGTLLIQVQVMPGFNNSIIYHFTTPGTYYVRCMEFCGYGHYEMIANFNVTSS
jgi:cytochrome c oxidase subunit II